MGCCWIGPVRTVGCGWHCIGKRMIGCWGVW
jgi:hypothetical protein